MDRILLSGVYGQYPHFRPESFPCLRKTAFSANVSARPRLQHRTCSPPSFCNSPLAVPFSDDQIIKSCAADRFSLFIRHLSRRPVQLTEKVRRRQNTGCIGKNPSGKPSSKAMYPLPGLSAPLSKTSVLQKNTGRRISFGTPARQIPG